MGAVLCQENQGILEVPDEATIELPGVNADKEYLTKNLDNFEKQYPFYRLKINDYTGRIKRFVQIQQQGTVNMAQLIYAFEKVPSW